MDIREEQGKKCIADPKKREAIYGGYAKLEEK